MPEPARLSARPGFWSFTVPWDVGVLSPNQAMHHMKKYRLSMMAKRAAAFVWIQQGRPRAQSRVRVDITIRRATRMDEDNIVSGAKSLLDGLFKAGLTPDDSPKWVSLGTITQRIDPKWKHAEEVQFDVSEVGPNSPSVPSSHTGGQTHTRR